MAVTKVNVGGEIISVTVASEEDEPELENRHAVFLVDDDGARILIDDGVPASLRWRYLGHEILHATNRHIGFESLLRKQFSLSDSQAEELEEFICAHITPAYLDTLERNGWLKPPKI